MSTYTGLKGLRVKYLAANPNPGTAGDIWYDSVTYELKGFVGRSAWSSGTSLSTARREIRCVGTQTSALGAGGYTTPPVAFPTAVEEYNG